MANMVCMEKSCFANKNEYHTCMALQEHCRDENGCCKFKKPTADFRDNYIPVKIGRRYYFVKAES